MTDEVHRILAERQAGIGEGTKAMISALDRASDDGVRNGVVRELPDRELLTAATWIEHGMPSTTLAGDGVKVILAECKHRAQQGRTFAAYLPQPTIGDILRRLLNEF